MAGTGDSARGQGRRKVVFFTSREAAEAETGFFRVSNLMLSEDLEARMKAFIREQGLETWVCETQTKTGWHSHTLNFRLTTYQDPDKRAYLSDRGALGSYKSAAVKPAEPSGGFMLVDRTKRHQKYLDLKERTPEFDQMYFWIAAKYPRDILWMDYTLERPDWLAP